VGSSTVPRLVCAPECLLPHTAGKPSEWILARAIQRSKIRWPTVKKALDTFGRQGRDAPGQRGVRSESHGSVGPQGQVQQRAGALGLQICASWRLQSRCPGSTAPQLRDERRGGVAQGNSSHHERVGVQLFQRTGHQTQQVVPQ
jgi:hypothetical protein